MAIHFVADLHFNGDNARYAHPHGFRDSAEMTRRICDVWTARVAPEDTVWILGNVGNAVHLATLPGTKHLVRSAQDPQAWHCLATGRYASVSDRGSLRTEQGTFHLVASPRHAPLVEDARVLHGHAPEDWAGEGFLCVSAAQRGWGPVSLTELLGSGTRLRRAA